MLKVVEEEEKTYIPDDVAPMERLVVRDLPYNQSSNTLRIRHQISKKHSKESGLRNAGSISFFHWYIEVSTLCEKSSFSKFTLTYNNFIFTFDIFIRIGSTSFYV